jgi:hypothetical protein
LCGRRNVDEAEAFVTQGLTRRDALWATKALKARAPLPLFGPDGEGGIEPTVTLPQMTLRQEVPGTDCPSAQAVEALIWA